ncbi:MAG TPA: GNAT family N-acetyltransferase [Gammaproteobacteria bacterium]|nr:GNAT family N-acetyltransferase [Gammaproteobacteria bacterium]
MSKMNVREAGPADAEQVTRFSLACARDSENLELDRDTVRAGVENALNDPARGRYFLAEAEGAAVGQIMVTREWSDWRNTWIWWLQSVYVNPDARGKGVFVAIYTHIEQLAREAGAASIRLYVDKGNAAAERAYLKAGFELDHYNQMAKSLNPS